MTTISMDKQYTTRDGRPVRLLCVDAPGPYPVVGLDGEILRRWGFDGWPPNDQQEDCLIEAKPRVQCEVSILRSFFTGEHKALISRSAYDPKIWGEIARFPIDVEEGHGLEDQP